MGATVLVVEDEAAIAETIVYALKTEGFTPRHCLTGEQALADIRRQAPDLVILDIGLPDVSGFDLCREIRHSSAVPIIILSARQSELDRVVGLEIGADDYVVKPFSPRELTARVRARLRRHSPKQDQAVGFAHDAQAQSISWQGRRLKLTRYEYRVFAILMERPRRVFSRDELLDGAWEEHAGAYDRTVDTHIKTLRAKLRDAGAPAARIRTHRGSGYAFDPD